MNAFPPFRAGIQPEWIDYNGHLRDACYGLIVSQAMDDFLDWVGLDAAYRASTRCTLYTLEWHMHFLHEVKSTDSLMVHSTVLDADRKRIHLGCQLVCDGRSGPVATADALLLHVMQGDTPRSAEFPASVYQALLDLKPAGAALAAWGPTSRKIDITRRPDA